MSVLIGGCSHQNIPEEKESAITAAPTETTETTAPPETTEPPTTAATEPTAPAVVWETGYIAAAHPDAAYCDSAGNVLGTFLRGTQVEYMITPEGICAIRVDDTEVYLQEGASVVSFLPRRTALF